MLKKSHQRLLSASDANKSLDFRGPALARRNLGRNAVDDSSVARQESRHKSRLQRRVLVIDIGGTSIKALISGNTVPIKIVSGPQVSPAVMLTQLLPQLVADSFDVVTIGVPAPVNHGRIVHEPYNLGKGWVRFDFEAAFGHPVRLINDAAMQALGSYAGGHMLFLGLGTGLGSAVIVDGTVEPLELAHLPYRKHNFEYYVSEKTRKRLGGKKWRANVRAVIEVLRAALQPEYVVLGGGNLRHLGKLPRGVSKGDNDKAFLGGFRIWDKDQ